MNLAWYDFYFDFNKRDIILLYVSINFYKLYIIRILFSSILTKSRISTSVLHWHCISIRYDIKQKLNQVFLQNIEARLKMVLPADLAPALSDGVVLCHLANHVRPRSVASIHVPSPAVVSIHLKIYNTENHCRLLCAFTKTTMLQITL